LLSRFMGKYQRADTPRPAPLRVRLASQSVAASEPPAIEDRICKCGRRLHRDLLGVTFTAHVQASTELETQPDHCCHGAVFSGDTNLLQENQSSFNYATVCMD
jgi:hypothetical protein